MQRKFAILRALKIKGLYAITPETINTDELVDKTRQALEGGVQAVQYRNKSADRYLQRSQATLLLQLCKQHYIPLIINDYIDLALEIDADGLHVGRDDGTIANARKHLGSHKILGASCYNDLDLALHAERQGANYVAFGAFFPSITKSNTVPVSIDFVQHARKQIKISIVGIGGIQLHNASPVIQSGCDAIAVCSDLFANGQTKAKAAQFAQLFPKMI
jgi:thiamine-phosphate pyrophosphorylase